METKTRAWTLGQLAQILNGELNGPADHLIERPVPAGSNDVHGITFAGSADYLAKALESSVGAILVPKGTPAQSIPTIQVENPRAAFGYVLAMSHRPLPIQSGIHATAVVSPTAQVSATASIGAYVVIEPGAIIEDEAKIYPFAYIGENCKVGPKAIIYPHAVLYQDVSVGEKSIVHAGSVIGADGFGYFWNSPQREFRQKVPQVGNVQLGANVEIGSLTAIDRATAGSTTIADGTKIDNLVQIAHNCVIGSHTVIASQAGISGSTTVGDRVDIGGQVGTADHVTIGDDVILAARAGATKSVLEPGAYWGVPATPLVFMKRVIKLTLKLPETMKTIKDLERRIADLEKDQK